MTYIDTLGQQAKVAGRQIAKLWSGDPRGPGGLGLDRPERRPQVRILSISMY